jgi:hypothetical protein
LDIIQGVELRGHEGLAIDIDNPICGVIGIVVQNGRIRIAEMYEPAELLGGPSYDITHPF